MRREDSNRGPVIAATIFILSMVGIAAFSWWIMASLHRHIDSVHSLAIPPPAHEPCFSYPHALVECGVWSNDDLNRVRVGDLAVHYAEIGNIKPVVLPHDLHLFVSFRSDDGRIAWTPKPLTIHKGETVFMDGKLDDGIHMIRARCGNRLSVFPQTPTAPMPPDLARDIPTVHMPDEWELPPAQLVRLMIDTELPELITPLPARRLPIWIQPVSIPTQRDDIWPPFIWWRHHPQTPITPTVMITPEISEGWMMILGVVFLWIAGRCNDYSRAKKRDSLIPPSSKSN